jgi:hypothetical protein
MSAATAAPAYPIGLEIDAPAPQNRLSVLLRYFYMIPHLIALTFVGIGVLVVQVMAWFVILFTGQYPEGMLNFAVGASRWSARANGYFFLLTDKYPPFSLEEDSAYPIRLVGSGQIEGRNRLTCFFRPLMVLPHAIVLGILFLVGFFVLAVAWVAALVGGSVPQGLHDFMAGLGRWFTRVNAYAMLLTDEYPPFSLD